VQHPRLFVAAGIVVCALAWPCLAAAQQRPLATEDPEPIGAGRVLLEGGMDVSFDQQYPASGLEGTLVRLPTLGLSIGIGPMAELQLDSGLFNHLSISDRRAAPLSSLLTVTGDGTQDLEDLVVATKVRFKAEQPGSPSFAIRFATRLPNATNESGLGLDTFDFFVSLLGGKTVRSVRIVGNVGLGILGDPTTGHRQNDVLTYGASAARATSEHAEIVAELNGRLSTRSGVVPPGTESRSRLNFGVRYTSGAFRLDGGFFVGLTDLDPTLGFTAGFTYVFDAFEVP
jgi:hypothetical protein